MSDIRNMEIKNGRQIWEKVAQAADRAPEWIKPIIEIKMQDIINRKTTKR